MDLWSVLGGVVVLALLASAVDIYWLLRSRWIRNQEEPYYNRPTGDPLTRVPGIDATGELTTSAKYAIWNYMFTILGVGGAIVGIVAGIAGYMINDLAKE